jgi:hypothetical protein
MSDVLRTPTLSSYAYLGCRDRGIAVGYHSLGVYHGMLEYVIMIIRTKIAATVHASPSGAGVLEGAAADTPSGVVAGVGYPFLFEPPAAGDPSPSAEIINRLREATALLNDTIEEAVAATREADVKIVYVDVTAAFVGHGIGTRDPQDLFINRPGPTPSVEDFHPNVAGYVTYADAIATKLPNGWLDKNKQLV